MGAFEFKRNSFFPNGKRTRLDIVLTLIDRKQELLGTCVLKFRVGVLLKAVKNQQQKLPQRMIEERDQRDTVLLLYGYFQSLHFDIK